MQYNIINIYIGALTFIFGLLIGSFLNVCIYRIPNGMSVAKPPSHCPKCKNRLVSLDLIPVFSYLFLGRKCRYCKTMISPRYMYIELLTGIMFFLCFLSLGTQIILIPYLCLTGILICITFIDLDHYIIPNGIVIFGIIIAIIFVLIKIIPDMSTSYLSNLIDAGLGFISSSVILIIIDTLSKLILKKEGIGGGDIKLMAMVGLFLGWKLTLLALLIGVYIGGIYGVITLVGQRYGKGNNQAEIKDDNKDNNDNDSSNTHMMPFGPFLSIGVYISMLYGTTILNWYLSIII